MKSILVTYPNFRELPKGIKQMLLASESLFFDDVKVGGGTQKQPYIVLDWRPQRLRAGILPYPSWRN